MVLTHSRRPSMAGFRGGRRESHPCDSYGPQNRYEPSPDIQRNCCVNIKSKDANSSGLRLVTQKK